MKYINKFNLVVLVVLISISLYLVLRWLPPNTIIAGGDIGIPNLFPNKLLKEVSSSWWDSHGTGISSPTTYTSVPYYLFLSFLEILGLSPDLTQKLVFFLILFGGSASIYFLALFFSFNKWSALVAALFYIFNLNSLFIWERSVHNAILMLLLAPLSLLILVLGIKQRKYSSIFVFNIFSFLLSYIFASLGHLFSLWLLWLVYLGTVLFNVWHNKAERKFILVYSFLLIVSWIGTNLWWILHFLQSSGYILGQFTAAELRERGSDVLVALKPYHEPQFILRGINSFSFYITKNWGDIYLSPFFILLSWIPTIVIFFTTLVKSNYKSLNFRFLILLTIIVLLISKGINPPFGIINKTAYDLFPILAPLRNPFEKVGILLIILYALLFALGIDQINSFFREKKLGFLRLITFFALFLSLTVLVFPLWLGKMYVGGGKKLTVSFPNYYFQASQWMESQTQKDDTRILHLPLAWWESVDYDWGYSGIEPSQYLFYGSSIGYHLDINTVDSRIRNILLLVHNQDTQSLQKAFASLNIGWVIVHNETLFRDRMLEPPKRINKWLAANPYFLEKVNSFGPLDIWRVKDQYRAGHLYSVDKLIGLENSTSLIPKQVWDNTENVNDSFVDITGDTKDSVLEEYVNKFLIFPKQNSAEQKLEIILDENDDKNLINESFNLSNIDVTTSYQISFNVLNIKNYPLYLTIAHDNDPLDDNNRIKPSIIQQIQFKDPYRVNTAIFNYTPPLNANSAVVNFIQSPNSAEIKNLKVEKVIKPEPVLEKKEASTRLEGVIVKWNKINPAMYELKLSQQIPPYILVFSETFHPLWQITDDSGKKIDLRHFIINGFANGWIIERTLPEKIKVEFVLQRVFAKSIIISVVAFIILLIPSLYLDFFRKQK